MVSSHADDSKTSTGELLRAPLPETKISCDYLVVGAGTACLSFVDTVLTLRKDVTFVIVDRFSAPGGHWTKAYPFVRLHQPSCYYGVNSLPLSKLDKNGNEPFDFRARASAKEICEYYKKVVEKFEATGRVTTFFDANYVGEVKNDDGSSNSNSNSNNYNEPASKITHAITTKNGKTLFVDCVKVVRSESNVQVPSMRDRPPFPIDKSVEFIPLNDLPSHVGLKSSHEKYLVIGGGKSGCDAINFLLKDNTIRFHQITWIVPRPAWYFISDRLHRKPKPGKRFWKELVNHYLQPFLDSNSCNECFLNMEKLGVAQRVDPDDGHFPTIFKGATLCQSEMDNLRKIENIVKNKGRVTSITDKEVVFANGGHSIPFSPTDTLVVDCTTEDTYGYLDFGEDFEIFNPHRIRLGPLSSILNISHTSAQVGFLESTYSDTASGDDMKNAYLFFLRGKSELREKGFLSMFVLQLYAHFMTDAQFDKCFDYRKFALTARTDRQRPSHHGGLMGLLWAIFGPVKLIKKANAMRTKFQNGGIKEFPTDPLPGRTEVDFSKHVANLRNPPGNIGNKLKPKKTMAERFHLKQRLTKKTSKQYVVKEMNLRETEKTIEIND